MHQSNKFAKKLGPDDSKGISVESELGKGSTFSFILENKPIDPFDEQLPSHVIQKTKTIDIFEQKQST